MASPLRPPDANVLFLFTLRDTLFRAAAAGIYQLLVAADPTR